MYKQPLSICILGGSGFVGRHLAARLVKDQHRMTIPTRHPDSAKALKVLPGVSLAAADCHDPKTLDRLFSKADLVINLVGILHEKKDNGKGFHHVHVELVEKIIASCERCGIRRFLHISALNAHPTKAPSYYLQSKGEAEEIIHATASEDFQPTVFRPSVIFGEDDRFLNRFAGIIRRSPYLIPLACAKARLAPVYVGDVAEAIARCVGNQHATVKTFELCGPDEYTLKELVEYLARLLHKRRKVIGLGKLSSKLLARILEMLPGKLMSRDNFRSLQVDSLCKINGLDELGIVPHTIEGILPQYLAGQTARRRYDLYRRQPPQHL